MARRRLLTVLASTLAAGALALPATALEVAGADLTSDAVTDVTETVTSEPSVESTVESTIEEEAAAIEEAVETATVADTTDADGSDDGSTGSDAETDDGGLLPTDEGEPLEPLAPVTDPVEQALAPILEPVEDALAPASPVTDPVDDVVDQVSGQLGDDTTTDPEVPATVATEDTAPANSTSVSDASEPAPATTERQSFSSYWSRQSAGGASGGSGFTSQPDVAAEPMEQIAAPQIAADQPLPAAIADEDGAASIPAALKLLATLMVAGTAAAWGRTYAAERAVR